MMTLKITKEEFEILLEALNLAGAAEPDEAKFDNLYDELMWRTESKE
jgi:hypothetical protein